MPRAGGNPEPALAAGLNSRAEQLLTAISVYREPADRNAVLFQFGTHDFAAARVPDRQGPAPPYQASPDLADLLAACVAAGVLTVSDAGPGGASAWLVDRWLAAELQERLCAGGKSAELADAHRRAAQYWQWRATAWPQSRRADIHDLLEARHHLVSCGDLAAASEVTRAVCVQLRVWGDLCQEAYLVQSTLQWLPDPSLARAGWLHELGAIASVRGDHLEAERRYGESATMFAMLGDDIGVARAQHSLGVLAQAQGEYRRAERHLRKAASAQQRARPGAAEPQSSATAATAATGAGTPPGAAGSPAETRAVNHAAAWDRSPALTADAVRTSAESLLVRPPGDIGRAEPALDAGAGAGGGGAGGAGAGAGGAGGGGAGAGAGAGGAPELAGCSPAGPAGLRQPGSRLPRRSVRGIVIIVLGLIALALAGFGGLARPRAGSASESGSGSALAAGYRADAAAWIAEQVSRAAVIACDPAMCAALQQRGEPTGDLLMLGPGRPADPLASDIVLATAAVRSEFGQRLAAVYAPLVVAVFGAGAARIEVRAIAPDGAAAYRTSISADQDARRRVGEELTRNAHLTFARAARGELRAGDVDTRLLAVLATLGDMGGLRIVEFGDAGPGADAAVPMRSVTITPARASAGKATWYASVRGFLLAQQPPYRPAGVSLIRLPGGAVAARIWYQTPGPLGLLAVAGAAVEIPAHPLK